MLAANLGDDADTVAAITGQLAGALWGASSFPVDCVNGGAKRDHLASAGRCQRKSNRSAQPQNRWISSRKLTPLCQGSRAMVLEVIAAVEGTLLIEMIVD